MPRHASDRGRRQPPLSARLVVGTQSVPAIELHRLRGELHQPGLGQPWQHGVECLLLADPGVEGVLALEAGRDPQRLAAVLAHLSAPIAALLADLDDRLL